MKKILMFVLAAFMLAVSFQNLYAVHDRDPEIIILPANYPETPIPNRNLVPITAYYNETLSSIIVSFNSDIGNVEMTITNQATGEIMGETINAFLNPVVVPLFNSTGVYSIVFELSNGEIFSGELEL